MKSSNVCVVIRSLQWTQQREQDYVAYGARVGQNHNDPIEPEALAARGGQAVRKGPDIILIHLMRLVVALFLHCELHLETVALLARIVQLGKCVADFHARGKY